MDKFISEHMYQKEIEVYLGEKDVFSGKVIACADGVLTLSKNDKLTFINIGMIKCLWEKK
ncbi:MAG: MM0924 family protein [Candidatus Helarchaeota archaeon]